MNLHREVKAFLAKRAQLRNAARSKRLTGTQRGNGTAFRLGFIQ